MDPRRWPLGGTNCASVVEYADDDGLPVDPAGLRGGRRRQDGASIRPMHGGRQRRLAPAECVQRRRETVALSAEVMEEQLHGQLERGEITMAEIRADYVRHCE